MAEEKIAIIGTGRVGTALTKALYETGFNISVVYDHDVEKANECASLCENRPQVVPFEQFPDDLSLIFFTVMDDKLAGLIKEVSTKIKVSDQTIVTHCSGAYSSQLLEPFADQTSHLASIHPVQSFPGTQDDWKRLFGIYFGLEGDEAALTRLKKIANIMQSRFVVIPTEKKVLYHLGCVMASNYLVSLISGALDVMDNVGFTPEDAFKIIQPLVSNTFENIKRDGPSKAATGPIPRGDIGTVKQHIQNLEQFQPEMLEIYTALGKQLVKTVYNLPNSDKTTLDSINAYLDDSKKK